MTFAEDLKVQLNKKESARWNIDTHYWFVIVLLVAAIALRTSLTTQQTTIFYDEAVNVTLGTELLAGDFTQRPTTWTFGSHIFPTLSALSSELGGFSGLQVMLLSLNLITMVAIYIVTHSLFNRTAALWSLFFTGFSGLSITISQFAVYDATGIPFLALALMCFVLASEMEGRHEIILLVLAGVLTSLSLLSKYIALLFMPVLGLSVLAIYLERKKSLYPLFTVALPVVIGIVGAYIFFFRYELSFMLTNQSTLLNVEADRIDIISQIVQHSGFILVFVVIGVGFLIHDKMIAGRPIRNVLVGALVTLIVICAFAAPIYQVWSQNIQSLWKHQFYGHLFLIPIASYVIPKVAHVIRTSWQNRSNTPTPLIALLSVIIILIGFSETSLGFNWGFKNSWPNATGVVEYLNDYPLSLETRILAEQSAVYEYYFDFGPNDRDVWSNTFYLEYRGEGDVTGMVRGIQDKYFDLVILDDYYTADKNEIIRDALQENNYALVYEDAPQVLSTGQEIIIEVYAIEEEVE